MRAVFDSVILVRGLMSPYSWWGQPLFDRNEEYLLIVAPDIIAEYLDVIRRPELVRKYRSVASRDPHAVLDRISAAEIVHPPTVPSVARDSEDDKFLAAARAGDALYLRILDARREASSHRS